MRLWHYELIPHLDRQRLLSQHRECCALRGKGWGKKHKTVDYVFKHSYGLLFNYHLTIIDEMEKRGYNVTQLWKNPAYRGQILGYDISDFTKQVDEQTYIEHDVAYYYECVNLLIEKTKDIDSIDYTHLLK